MEPMLILCNKVQIPTNADTFTVPVINLSSFDDLDTRLLRYGVDHCFINKNRYVKHDLAVEFENLASVLDKNVIPEKKEAFHEFLRSYTNRFSQNVFQTKNDTFRKLSALRAKNKKNCVRGAKIPASSF